MFTIAVAGAVSLAMGQIDPPARRKLAAPEVIDGVSCAATGRAYAEFHASGRLEACPVTADTTIAGQRLPAGTWIRLTDDRVLRSVWLPRDTDIGGYLCKGTGLKGWSVEFHPDGVLKLCFLAADREVDGVTCLGGSFWNEVTKGSTAIELREDGSIESCRAAESLRRNGVEVRKGSRVRFDVKGKVTGD
jgi:hypothetical protein